MVFLRALRVPRIGLLDESAVGFRVLPGDLDVNVHLNNGRYLALMDLGRFDLLIRGGLLRPRSLPVTRDQLRLPAHRAECLVTFGEGPGSAS